MKARRSPVVFSVPSMYHIRGRRKRNTDSMFRIRFCIMSYLDVFVCRGMLRSRIGMQTTIRVWL